MAVAIKSAEISVYKNLVSKQTLNLKSKKKYLKSLKANKSTKAYKVCIYVMIFNISY